MAEQLGIWFWHLLRQEMKVKEELGVGGRGDDFSLKVYGTIQVLRSGMPLDIRAWSLERGLVQL